MEVEDSVVGEEGEVVGVSALKLKSKFDHLSVHLDYHHLLFRSPFDWEATSISDSTSGLPPRQLPNFSEPTGPAPRTTRENTPLKIFRLFVSEPMFDLIVEQTRLFAIQQNDESFSISKEELFAFIGINVAMGMVRLPRVHDYWSTSPVFSMPWFSSIMSRDRFFRISKYLHLADASKQKKRGEDGYDALYKVRPLIDKTSETFAKYYSPKRELAIDEMMVGTRCRVHFLQYIPKKPTKWGIKIFVNSESCSGYVLTYEVYTGAQADSTGCGHTHSVVMKLMQKYLNKEHKLFTDNFYTSPKLFLELLNNRTYACGTIRTNRKYFPDELKHITLKRPEYKFATCNSFTAGIWHDRRDVTFLSTIHSASIELVQKRSKSSKEKEPIPCPTAIVEYNQSMNGVDITDQHLSYHSLTKRKTIKWWKKVFWRLIDMAILNANIVYRSNSPESNTTTNRQFRLALIDELVQPLLLSKASGLYTTPQPGRRPGKDLSRLKGKHFPYKHTSRRRRCVVCSNAKNVNNKRKDTKVSVYCPKCDEFMCMGECFEAYHTLVNYR